MSGKATRYIYFCGSIRGGREDAALYRRIIAQLKEYGDVLTEHIADADILDKDHGSDKYIHDRDMAWLVKSDAVVAEVTQPSLGVGYEIGRAIENNKKILCLFRPDSGKCCINDTSAFFEYDTMVSNFLSNSIKAIFDLSAMVRGAIGENLKVEDYKEEDVPKILKEFFDSLW